MCTNEFLSVSEVTKAGNEVSMAKNGGKITDRNGNVIPMVRENGVYVIKVFAKIERKDKPNAGFTRQGK